MVPCQPDFTLQIGVHHGKSDKKIRLIMYVAPDSGALLVSGFSNVDTCGGLLITLSPYSVLRPTSDSMLGGPIWE